MFASNSICDGCAAGLHIQRCGPSELGVFAFASLNGGPGSYQEFPNHMMLRFGFSRTTSFSFVVLVWVSMYMKQHNNIIYVGDLLVALD